MIIVRAYNSETGEVWEVNSHPSHPSHIFEKCENKNSAILKCAIEFFSDILEGDDNDFDRIEVIAR